MLDENSQNYLYFFGIRKPTNIYIFFLLDYVLLASILNIFPNGYILIQKYSKF